jgi:hypothetical protein
MDGSIAVIREGLERDGFALDVEVMSLGGRELTKLTYIHAPEPIYLLVSDDTLFTVGGADDAPATELVRQIP